MINTRDTLLFLGPSDLALLPWLRKTGAEVVQTMDVITPSFVQSRHIDFAVSYGYRYIIEPPVLECLPDRIVNLHISLLPWNRGADPNFWSFVDDTPKGVTIHYVDAGIDTGDIIVQREVEFGPNDTLRTTFAGLLRNIEALFHEHWPAIRAGSCPRRRQSGPGSYHPASDKAELDHLLPDGWDTPVSRLRGLGETG